MKAGLLSMNDQPEADKILGITYEGDLRGIEDEKGVIVPLELSWENIVDCRTDFLAIAFSLYSDWVVFKVLPNGKGTRDERPTVLEALKILSSEDNQWQCWEMEKQHGKERT